MSEPARGPDSRPDGGRTAVARRPRRVAVWTGVLALALQLVAACDRPRPRSELSFQEIQRRVDGKSAAEVLALLGEPDARKKAFLQDERWIWWDYTFLAGNDFAPEVRGSVVHLEILFRNPAPPGTDPPPYSEWLVDEPFGVHYRDRLHGD